MGGLHVYCFAAQSEPKSLFLGVDFADVFLRLTSTQPGRTWSPAYSSQPAKLTLPPPIGASFIVITPIFVGANSVPRYSTRRCDTLRCLELR